MTTAKASDAPSVAYFKFHFLERLTGWFRTDVFCGSRAITSMNCAGGRENIDHHIRAEPFRGLPGNRRGTAPHAQPRRGRITNIAQVHGAIFAVARSHRPFGA